MSLFKSRFSGRSESAQMTETKPDEWRDFLTNDENKSYDEHNGFFVSLNKVGSVTNCLMGAALLATGNPVGMAILAVGVMNVAISGYNMKKSKDYQLTAMSRAARSPANNGGMS